MQALAHAHWQEVIDTLQEAIWLIDEATLTILIVNHNACELTGRSSQDMVGAHVQTLAATPQDVLLWRPEGANTRCGAPACTHVLRGAEVLVPVLQQVRRIALPQGALLMLSMLDRSEQQQHEREYESLLAELRATLDSAADGMLVCAIDGTVRAFNQRLALMWGMPRQLLVRRDDAAVQEHMLSQVHDAQAYHARLQTIVSNPMLESTDVVALRSGTVVERRSVPQLVRGLPVGRVFSFRDITHQAEIQAGLRLAARVFESSLDAIFIADDQHRIMRMNPGCEHLVGHGAGERYAQAALSLFEEGVQRPDFQAQVLAAWAEAGFWEGELHLPRAAHLAPCPVHLSWVALRDDSGAIVQSIGFMRDLTAQHAAQRRIEELAYKDALTGLPNRLMLLRHLEQAIANAGLQGEGKFAVLFLDLDRFKNINDSLGHQFGDRVLQLVAQRLQGCLRQTDMLCRLGGDEFVVYLHASDAATAERVAQRILSEMAHPMQLDGLAFSVQCSIGLAMYPSDSQTLDELIKQADTAMYRAKEQGRGVYSFYCPQMSAHLLPRMQMEHAMRQALGLGHMAVHYQPLVCMESGRITGAEALLRWNDPAMGIVSPASFIPLAEECGYILTLGAWVLEQAFAQAARWLQAGCAIRLSVNVSALEFRQADYVQRLTQLLHKHGIPTTLLELELTETILLHDAQEMAQRLQTLSQLGVRLVIDDFGTGYSSLAYLKNLPIDKLKIDRSFVRGLPDDASDRAIVRAIVSMGQALGIDVIAEGVETPAQHAALVQLECPAYQGFLCAPALSATEFLQLLHERGAQQPHNLASAAFSA